MIEDRPWNSAEYRAWRLAVYRRDGFKCKMPGCGIKKRLNAHHIQRWADHEALRFVVRNGITLCSKHHKRITGHEEEYETVLRSLVSGSDLAMQLIMARYAGNGPA
jgi:hypothetical protein